MIPMHRTPVAFLMTLAFSTMGACDSMVGVDDEDVFGSGIVVTEFRAVANFTGVRASGAFEVVVEQAETEGVEVTAGVSFALGG